MFKIPTLKELYDQSLQDLQTEMGISILPFGKMVLRAQAAWQSAKLKLYYLLLGKVQKNLFADTAEPESMGGTLERIGRLKINRNPFPATSGKYDVTVTATGNAFIPTGTIFKSLESALNSGVLLISDQDYNIDQVNNIIELRALNPGLESKLNVNDGLSCTVPIVGITGEALVIAETVSPTAAESEEDYRQAIIDSYRLEPQGGASADYILWAQDAQGVKASYPYTSPTAAAEVDIYVEASPEDSTDGMGTPTQTILDNVASVLEIDPNTQQGRTPLSVWANNVYPVVINKLTITINNSAGITESQKAIINAAIKEQVDEVRPFIAGADILEERNDTISTNQVISWMINAIPGLGFGAVEMSIQIGSSSANTVSIKTFSYGNIPYLVNVVYA
ncbi:MAG: hypothetical protein BGO31_00150 [Bacteroidetes bacterium 43-16]|nr:MAG: hypothetical protein BGO31_00150 [Bacteroidetes bacterium 43-16]